MGVPATVVTLLLASADAGTGNADSPAAHTIATSAETASQLGERTFASRRQPKARRTRAWTRDRRGDASGWVSNYPQMHFSRFLDLARPTFHPPWIRDRTAREWRGALFRFTSAVIADMRDALRVACPPGRCSSALSRVDGRLGTFLAAGVGGFTYADRSSSSDRWNTRYAWRLTAGEVSFEIGCDEITEGPEVACNLDLALTDDLVLTYESVNGLAGDQPDFTIHHRNKPNELPLGIIRLERSPSGAPQVLVNGMALAPRPEGR